VKEEDGHVDWLEEQLDQIAQLVGCAELTGLNGA
jgi:bacterioferritin (cytochrome b1)